MFFRKTALLSSAVAAFALVGCASNPSDGKKWACGAPGLISAYYSGGNTASVHLQGFQTGGTYAVTKNAAGTEATGKTANGTTFVCKQSS